MVLKSRDYVFNMSIYEKLFIMPCPLGIKRLEISPFDRVHDFLLTFNSNYGSILCRFWDIQCRNMSWPSNLSWPWNRGQRSLKVIESGTIR